MKAFSFQYLRRGSGIASFGYHNTRWVTERICYVHRNVRRMSLDVRDKNQVLKSAVLSDNVHILGIGNVGRFFAYAIANVPNPPKVTLLLHRESLLDEWKKVNRTVSLTIDNTGSTSGKYNVEVLSLSTTNTISNLIITTKATRVLTALTSVKHRLNPQSTTLFTQNGMGIFRTSDEANKSLKHQLKDAGTFIGAINTHGIFSNGPFSSTLAGKANLTISSPTKLSKPSSAFVNLLTSSDILNADIIPWPEFLLRKLEKLAINACINPLTALLTCKNGELLTQPPIIQLTRLLLSEISQLLQCLPVILTISNSANSLEFDIPTRFSAEELEQKVVEVAKQTAANTSSMLQDVQAGRETEIEFITGYLLKRGRECGVDMPVNEQVYNMVKAGRSLKVEDVKQFCSI